MTYIQNHWPIWLKNRAAEARAFFADQPIDEAKRHDVTHYNEFWYKDNTFYILNVFFTKE